MARFSKPNSRTPRLFISYSHRGNGPKWKNALLRALHVFEQHHLIDVWQDGKVRVSSYWNDDIVHAMNSAAVAVVLLTPEALESEYILNTEFPTLRERQRNDDLPVFPVICEQCDWRIHDWLRATQAANNSNPLRQLSETEQDQAFYRLATEIAEELSRAALAKFTQSDESPPPDRIYLDKFPIEGAAGLRDDKLIGREQELALLNLALAQPHTAIVSLVAWGGVGKTMLVQHWLRHLQHNGWLGMQRIYGWSFYSQGTKEDKQASEDSFLAHALEWFGIKYEPTLAPRDKGRLLADAVGREKTLLILDGVEPLQYPPGPMGGQLRVPGVHSLAKHLARRANSTDHAGLCLVTTREPLTDLNDFQSREGSAWGRVLRVDLGNLSENAGAALLHHAGANKAGPASVKPDDKELLAASREVNGHALTLNLLSRFLARAHSGDIRRRDLVKFEEADRNVQGGTTFKMLAAFENWFACEGDIEARALAILKLLGLFDRPAEESCMAALRKPPAITGLTEPLFIIKRDSSSDQMIEQPLSDKAWNDAIHFLADFGLLHTLRVASRKIDGISYAGAQIVSLYGPNAALDQEQSFTFQAAVSIDVHPLIRQYFETKLLSSNERAYFAGHRRLFEFIDSLPLPYWPSTLESLQPLYQSIVHCCKAGSYSEAFDIFMNRVVRGTGDFGFFSTRHLGAFSEDLVALSSFFQSPWSISPQYLNIGTRAWLLNGVAYLLRGLGRLLEADAPLRHSLALRVEEGNWRPAVNCAFNLSDLNLMLGRIEKSLSDAKSAITYSQNPSLRVNSEILSAHVNLGNVLFNKGETEKALSSFHDAEEFLRNEPQCRLLYGVAGANYCNLILTEAEKAAWRQQLTSISIDVSARKPYTDNSAGAAPDHASHIDAAYDRMLQVIQFMRKHPEASLLSIATCQLVLLQAITYRHVLGLKSFNNNKSIIDSRFSLVLEMLRRSNVVQFLISGLLSLSWYGALNGNLINSSDNLNEAWDIAERGPMRLHMANIHLYRARLFFREKHYPWKSPKDDLEAAEKLIQECGYHRRDEELADAKRAILQ